MREAQVLKLLLTLGAQGLVVIIGNKWQAQGATVLQTQLLQPQQVGHKGSDVVTGIAAVDVGVAVLDVDEPVVNEGGKSLYVLWGNRQTRLDIEVPFRGHKLVKLSNEVTPQTRFTSSETDAAARGQEIEVIDFDPLQQFLRREVEVCLFGRCALRIEAIGTLQRTLTESRQRGHSLAIGGNAVSRHADEGGAR